MSRRPVVLGLAVFVALLLDLYIRAMMTQELMQSNARNVEACKDLTTELRERTEQSWLHSRKRL